MADCVRGLVQFSSGSMIHGVMVTSVSPTTTALHKGDVSTHNGNDVMNCDVCGFRHLWPIPSAEGLEDFYAGDYVDPLVKTGLEGRVRNLHAVGVKPGRMLDVGCGAGGALEAFAGAGWNVTGLDPSRECTRKLSERGFGMIRAALPCEPPPGFEPVDLVHMSYVLEHVPDPIKVLNSIRSDWLAPGGHLLIDVPNDFNPLQLLAEPLVGRAWWVVSPDHINYFTTQSLERLLNRCGFEVTERTTDFPMELFLLMGENYVGNPEVGKACHGRRVHFEDSFGSNPQLLQDLYGKLTELNTGRSINVVAQVTDID